ncbi:MAG: DUF2442 domain-containing protein [Clostridiales bacterium]|jgi:hypothetical protein|nr:DUF2442 domain-containing protein [Clostridiales bacterium]
MSKMLKVTPTDDYTLIVEFENGNLIVFNMKDLIETMPYSSLKDLNRFKNITLEEKAICWPDPIPGKAALYPIRLTVDNMLFAIRE